MSLYRRLLFPAFSRIDAETAHELTIRGLARAQKHFVGRAFLRRIRGQTPHRPINLFGLQFPNELGVAAGFDKNAQVVPGLSLLGFGHVEVGTLTPRPQEGNPRPRIFRLTAESALINRMGFPNCGATKAARKLQASRQGQDNVVVGVSLGKQKDTALDEAVDDYLSVMRTVYPYADYLAVNVSSPNTPGLRALQRRRHLSQLLQALMADNQALAAENQVPARPLLLKISPDLTWEQLDTVLEAAIEWGVSGIVATNTTTSREGISGKHSQQSGGLSGPPLRARSKAMIAYIWRQCGGHLPIIGAGGVAAAEDARQMLDSGATLIQLYTGLVYGGPGIAGRILRGLEAR